MLIGSRYFDNSIAALTANQAAGTDPVSVNNAARRAIMIVPPADCFLKLSSGAGTIPLFGGVANTISGIECPTNNLYIAGLSQGAAVTIWEA